MKVRDLLRMLRHTNRDAEVYVRVGTARACQWEAHGISSLTAFHEGGYKKAEGKLRKKYPVRLQNILDAEAKEVTIEGRPGGRRKP